MHVRNIAPSIGDWPRLLGQAFRCVRPGGHVELAEIGCDIFSEGAAAEPANALVRIFDLLNFEALPRIGRHPADNSVGPRMQENLRRAGFVDIEVRMYKNPLGPWPKDKRMKHIGAMVSSARAPGAGRGG